MTCRELATFLSDYLNGEVDAGVRARFDGHLAECPMCAVYLKTYLETIKLGKAALLDSDENLPTDVPEQLVHAVLAARSRRS